MGRLINNHNNFRQERLLQKTGQRKVYESGWPRLKPGSIGDSAQNAVRGMSLRSSNFMRIYCATTVVSAFAFMISCINIGNFSGTVSFIIFYLPCAPDCSRSTLPRPFTRTSPLWTRTRGGRENKSLKFCLRKSFHHFSSLPRTHSLIVSVEMFTSPH